MPLFALPIVTSSKDPRSRDRFSSLPPGDRRKRIRTQSPNPPPSENSNEENDLEIQAGKSDAAASNNPFSLAPAEVAQFRLAGLELDEDIPNVKDWPHRGLPPEGSSTATWSKRAVVKEKGKGKETAKNDDYEEDLSEEEVEDREDTGESREKDVDFQNHETSRVEEPRSLRLQHLAVLTAILQKCLLEGDILRASRAWSMLIRAQINGHGMDLRASGYWAIGAELLIRSGEKATVIDLRRDGDKSDEEKEFGKEQDLHAQTIQEGEKRYGTAAGLKRVTDPKDGYYATLLTHFPPVRRLPERISALDIYPVMVGCEIYGIQYEQRESLRKAALEELNEKSDSVEVGSDSEIAEEYYHDESYIAGARRKSRRRLRRAEMAWEKRENIRLTALRAYEDLALRLEKVQDNVEFSESTTLWRLRGMLALCIGDLKVPALPVEESMWDEEEDEERIENNHSSDNTQDGFSYQLLYRQRLLEHERAKEAQKEKHIEARQIFERIDQLST